MMKRTVKSTLLEILNENPDGLTASKLKETLLSRYACDQHNVPVLMCHLVKEKKIIRTRKMCDCCRMTSTFYKLPRSTQI